MPDGQNQGPDVASRSAAESPARQPIFESPDVAPAAPSGGDCVAGLFAPGADFRIAGDASMSGLGIGQTMLVVGEPWP